MGCRTLLASGGSDNCGQHPCVSALSYHVPKHRPRSANPEPNSPREAFTFNFEGLNSTNPYPSVKNWAQVYPRNKTVGENIVLAQNFPDNLGCQIACCCLVLNRQATGCTYLQTPMCIVTSSICFTVSNPKPNCFAKTSFVITESGNEVATA